MGRAHALLLLWLALLAVIGATLFRLFSEVSGELRDAVAQWARDPKGHVRRLVASSLFVAGANAALSAIAFAAFFVPRFTEWGLLLCRLILVLLGVDGLLVIRDLWRSGTRARALGALVLWLPVAFLFGMIRQWEGPLYAAASGNPPVFQVRGLSGLCNVDVYGGPEYENREWGDDGIGLLWSIYASRAPHEAEFKYGEVPFGFVQVAPKGNVSPPPLDPNVTYRLDLGRCQGGMQYLSLHGDVISEPTPDPNVCWGDLKVAERKNPARVRVDCKTHQPLPMSNRAAERLKQYRENRIPFY